MLRILIRVYSTWVSRAMLVTNTPLISTDMETFVADGLSYAVFSPGGDAGNTDEPIYSIHQSQESMACPKGQCKSNILLLLSRF